MTARMGSLTLTITGNTFVADISGVCDVGPSPPGLGKVFTRDSDTQITLTYTDRATSHDADFTSPARFGSGDS